MDWTEPTIERAGPKPIAKLACSACGHLFTAAEPDPGCGSPNRVPISTLIAASVCETCYRRGTTSETCGAVNQKSGTDVRRVD